MRFLGLLCVLAAACVSGCYGGKGTEVANTGFPDGVDPGGDAAMHAGVYPAGPTDAANCCWLAGHATFRTTVLPAGAKVLHLTVLLPSTGPYDKRPESAKISIDGAPPKTFSNLRAGIRVFEIPLVPSGEPRQAVIDFVAGYAFVPTNGDTRSLTMELKSVRAQ